MFTNILQYFKQFNFLSLEDMRLLSTMCSLKTFQKGEIISRAGTVNYNGVVVLKGLLRAYTITSSGEEITLAFALPGMELGSPPSMFNDLPSIDTIEALESTIVFEVDTRKLDILAQKNFRLTKLHNKILKKTVLNATQRIEFYLTLNSEERFDHLQKTQPELIQRVPQKYLASYIGVTEVSLSRLKTRIMNKEKTGSNEIIKR